MIIFESDAAFQALLPKGITICWSAYAGMSEEVRISSPLNKVGAQIVETRKQIRAKHDWIVDIYLLRRASPSSRPLVARHQRILAPSKRSPEMSLS